MAPEHDAKIFHGLSVYQSKPPEYLGASILKPELDLAFAKLMNPRMSAGLKVLHSLLEPLKGPPVPPRDVRKHVDQLIDERKVSKQSVTNAARRLEEANIIEREEGYQVNYGYLISVLLNSVIEMTERLNDLEDEIDSLKAASRSSD